MAVNIVTTEDLHTFRLQLLDVLQQIFSQVKPEPKQWLKSAEVRELLRISPGTLQNLRINGTLKFTKIGSIHYYPVDAIHQLLKSKIGRNLNSPMSEEETEVLVRRSSRKNKKRSTHLMSAGR
jgi:hypothetical protein